MSDGRGGPDAPGPESSGTAHGPVHAHAQETGTDASAPDHLAGEHTSSTTPGTTPDPDGGFTDPTPGQDGIIVQGGRTTPGSQESARAIGPKQDDPRATGPKQDDPRTIADGIIVQGGRTGHPDKKARQKRAKKKMKTMALVIGGAMVVAVGGAIVGRQLGQDPATILPQAAATPTDSASADAPGASDPSASSGTGSSDPTSAAPSLTGPTADGESPTTVASAPPARSGGSRSPGGGTPSTSTTRSTMPAQPPTQSSAPPAQAAAPVLALRPTSVQEYCANGEWPNTLVVRNSGGGDLKWSVGQLPSGVTISEAGGSLTADSTQEITLGGRTEQPPASGRFTISFSSTGGSGQVTVNCA